MSVTTKHNTSVGRPRSLKSAAERRSGDQRTRSNSRQGAVSRPHPGLILEHNTENKRRRGRPRLLTYAAYVRGKNNWGVTGTRTLQNRAYLTRAIQVLGMSKRWEWFGISDQATMAKGKTQTKLRCTVLTELGRVRNDEDLRILAEALKTAAPASDRAAIAFVREWRMRRGMQIDTTHCISALHAFLKNYKKDRPLMQWRDIAFAMREVFFMLPRQDRIDCNSGCVTIDNANAGRVGSVARS